jgi:V/A-type H+-transporting ATPase subunit E
MTLDNVEKAVLEEARAEAERLLAEARSRLGEKLAAEKREIEERFAGRRRREFSRLDSEHHRELSRARTEARLEVLKEKNRLVEEVFSRALARLAKLPAEEFLTLAGKCLAQVPPELEGSVLAGERERELLAGDFMKKVNASRKGKLKLSDEAGPPGGGIVVRTERFEFDFSWAGRLADRKGALAPNVAATLFPHAEKKEAEQR